jgi:hypothetical protein
MQTVKQKIVYFIVRAPPRLLWRTVATYKILRLANFPIAGVRVPPTPLFEDKSKTVSSVRFPISSLRVPSKFIPNKFLRHSIE